MTESDIQNVLGKYLFRKKICIPNVSMYCPGKTEYEADFIYFDLNTQYLTEVEIKTDIHDFRRDFKKKRLHLRSSVGVNNDVMLANGTGIIDADYYNNDDNEGHIMIPIRNLGDTPFEYNKNERLAQ